MGSFLSRISDAFASVGTNKSARILLLGLDSAGKTTILYKLKINENVQTIPSNGFNVETFNPCPGVTLDVWDVGGREKIRRVWHQHYNDVEGVLFVIDSNDQERIEEAREVLEDILKAPEMLNVSIVIIANKQDLPNAMTPSEIINKLSLNNLHGKHKWLLQPSCAITGNGLTEAMLEMANFVKQNRTENN